MSVQANARPIIIKRKKVVGGGHHGGAWKVAYADFVTAMMAFFMLMWLLNATTEQQRKGLADYFSPTIPISRVSGGGDGSFGGDSIFSEETLPHNGTGASSTHPTESQKARGDAGDEAAAAQDEVFETIEEMLVGHGGESSVMENELRHITTRITDEGLIIEIFALENRPLFDPVTNKPTALLDNLAQLISSAARAVTNSIAVEGHVPTQPIVLARNSTWGRSIEEADMMRLLLEDAGIESNRIKRMTGHGDREPISNNPMAIRNNRLEIVLLRK